MAMMLAFLRRLRRRAFPTWAELEAEMNERFPGPLHLAMNASRESTVLEWLVQLGASPNIATERVAEHDARIAAEAVAPYVEALRGLLLHDRGQPARCLCAAHEAARALLAQADKPAAPEAERRLRAAGFEPDFNVCAGCKHHGSDHSLSNTCLICSDFFGMTACAWTPATFSPKPTSLPQSPSEGRTSK